MRVARWTKPSSTTVFLGEPAPFLAWPTDVPKDVVVARAATRAAIAYRAENALHILALDPSTGKALGKAKLVDRAATSAAAIAYANDVLHVVWAAKDKDGTPALKHAAITDLQADSAPEVEVLRAAPASLESPVIARRGEGWLVAWSEKSAVGDEQVVLGSSTVSLRDASASAERVSTPKTIARAPRLAWPASGPAWIAWWEGSAAAGIDVVYATVDCPPATVPSR